MNVKCVAKLQREKGIDGFFFSFSFSSSVFFQREKKREGRKKERKKERLSFYLFFLLFSSLSPFTCCFTRQALFPLLPLFLCLSLRLSHSFFLIIFLLNSPQFSIFIHSSIIRICCFFLRLLPYSHPTASDITFPEIRLFHFCCQIPRLSFWSIFYCLKYFLLIQGFHFYEIIYFLKILCNKVIFFNIFSFLKKIFKIKMEDEDKRYQIINKLIKIM